MSNPFQYQFDQSKSTYSSVQEVKFPLALNTLDTLKNRNTSTSNMIENNKTVSYIVIQMNKGQEVPLTLYICQR